MKLYSHRGNLNGKDLEWENDPSRVKEALSEKFYVAIDVYAVDGILYGKNPNHQTRKFSFDFLQQYKYQLLIRADNFDAIKLMRSRDLHYYCMVNDSYSISSRGWTIMNEGDSAQYDYLTIMLHPEEHGYYDRQHLCGVDKKKYRDSIGAIVTDYPREWVKNVI